MSREFSWVSVFSRQEQEQELREERVLGQTTHVQRPIATALEAFREIHTHEHNQTQPARHRKYYY